MPSQAALSRGSAAAAAIIDAHRRDNDGAYPATVAVSCCDTVSETSAPALYLSWCSALCLTDRLFTLEGDECQLGSTRSIICNLY